MTANDYLSYCLKPGFSLPMKPLRISLSGVVVGRNVFVDNMWLCVSTATLCMTACVTSLQTITTITLARYIYICHFQVRISTHEEVMSNFLKRDARITVLISQTLAM